METFETYFFLFVGCAALIVVAWMVGLAVKALVDPRNNRPDKNTNERERPDD